MRFWDSSAVVPGLVREPRTNDVRQLQAADADIWVWWATRTECLGAVARLAREGRFSTEQVQAVRANLGRLFSAVHEVPPSEALRLRAERVLGVHALRTADAFQLAAALVWAREQPAGSEFVSLDRRLRLAASAEGFTVLPMTL